MRFVELCAGAEALLSAATQAGFVPLALLECDSVACATITENQRRGSQWVKSWPAVSPVDIRDFDYSSLTGPVDLLSGGPPCQPFSLAGKHLGIDDNRDLFAKVARALVALQPRASSQVSHPDARVLLPSPRRLAPAIGVVCRNGEGTADAVTVSGVLQRYL